MHDLERILKALSDAEVRFVIIGGIASSLHGSTYVTVDLDVCYDRSDANLERLAKACKPYHPRLRGAPPDLPFHLDYETLSRGMNFTLTTDLGDLDLFGEVVGIGGFESVKPLSVRLEVFGRLCAVLSLAGLIQSKRASGRAKDLLVIPELEAL